MTKRQTAAQRRKEQRIKAIEMRLRDILSGAYGPYTSRELNEVFCEGMPVSYLGIDVLSRFIGGVRNGFGVPDDKSDAYPFNAIALADWDNSLDEVADWLNEMSFTETAMKGRW